MGKTKDLGHLAHIVAYDAENHITVPAGITMHTNQLVASQAWVTTALGSYALSSALSSYVPTSRTITINGTTYDLSADRTFTIAAGLTSFNTRTGAITLTSGDVTTALGFTPYNATNPAGYIASITSLMVTNALGFTPYNSTNPSGYITGISFANVSAKPTTLSGYGITDALGYISFTDSVGLNDNKLYLRTKGDNNHYIWNAADDWEEIVAYSGTGLRIASSTGVTLATFTTSGNSMNITGNAGTATAAAGATFLTQANATWGARLQIGGNGDPGAIANIAVVQATDGNLHMDSGTGKAMYLNYYRNGTIWLNGATYSISSNGSYYNGTAAAANAVAWGNVSSKPSLIMYYQGFTLDANTMDGNSTGFTYSVNAPYTGPIARFSETGYSLQLNAAYGGGGNLIAFRTRNGDAGSWNPWREFITSGNIISQKVDGSFRMWAESHPNDYYVRVNWTGAHWYMTSNHPSAVRVGYSDTAGNTNSISNVLGTSHTWTNVQYFLTNNGGQAVNNSNSANLQIYSTGNNTAFMSFHKAGHFAVNFGLDDDNVLRIGGWSSAANRWQLSAVSGDCTVSGFQRAVQFYTDGWFRNYGTGGLYQQDYGGHFARSTDGSFGTWQMWGGARNGYAGLTVTDPSGYFHQLMFESGQGGIYSENGSGWTIYLSRPNDCVGLNGSETYDWVRACTNGKHRITNDTWCDAISYASSFANISDGRFKENVVTIDSALDKILQLRGVYYNWIIDTEQQKHIGVIAQEVAEVLPEAVIYHDETDTYTVSYNDFSGVFIEGFKELNKKLTDANARIELLETKLNQLLNA